jgi:RNA polymerase sigma-70 factor (ECF subfamily)
MPKHLANEAELLDKAKLGDTDAFEILANQYRPQVLGLALRITGNREDADDVTQDSLLKAYVKIEQFRADSRFYTWLVRITVNQALIQLRKKRSKRELPWEGSPTPSDGECVEPFEIEDSGPNPEARCAGVEIQRIISRRVVALKPRLRKVFWLRIVEDFTVRETAQILGLSVAAVKSRSRIARINLRQQLSSMKGGFEGWSSGQPLSRLE